MKRCPTCVAEYPDDAQFCPHDGATLAPVAVERQDPFIGQVLAGRYEIRSKLGEGGMGSVYAARHCILGRIDAVKILRPETSGADAGHRFLREAKLAASINHPNAVVIHDFGQTESGVTFLAMEYIQGQSLTKLLQRDGPFPPARAVNIVRQVASALDAAHQVGVIHRDLKPDNIMVMEGDRVKVVDFGIAKAVGRQDSVVPMTQVGLVVGTPQYMSPEQAMGEAVDARSDVYALALVTYEMLTGVRPFAGDSMQAQMVARLSEPPRPMSLAAPQVMVPASIEAVVRQALAKKPTDRPPSAGAFAAQLEQALLAVGSTKAITSPPVGSVPTQYQGATLATDGGRSPATAPPARPAVGTISRPPDGPNVASGLPATTVQPAPSPPPMAAASLSPTLPTPPAQTPYPAPSAPRSNVWFIGGLVAIVGVVFLALVIGVVLYVWSVRPTPGAIEQGDTPSANKQGRGQTDVMSILQQSRSLREETKYDAALTLVDEGLAANPTSPELRIEKAEILFEQERFVESEDIVYAVLRSHPNYGPAYQNLGVLQYRQGKVEEAIANQKRCLEMNPEPEYACYAHAVLANIYSNQYFSDRRKFAARSNEAEMEARAALSTATRKSLEISPRLVLVSLFIDRQQPALAREQVTKLLRDNAFQRDQDQALTYAQLALIALLEKDFAEAAEAAERATQLDPQNKDYRKLADSLRRYRRQKAAS